MPRFFSLFWLVLIFVLLPNVAQTVAAEGLGTEEEILVRFSKGSDVFTPQEVVALEILPRSPKIFAEKLTLLTVTLYRTAETDGTVRISDKKFPDDSIRLSSTETEVSLPNEPQTVRWIPASLIMPQTEGIYEIGISFQRKGEANTGHGLLQNPLQRRPVRPVVQNVISCIVVNPAPLRRPIGELQIAVNTEQPETVDTANPAWWRRFPKVPALPKVTTLPRIPNLRLPSGTQHTTNTTSDGEWTSLGPGPLAELLEQWKTPGNNSFSSGHLKEQVTIPMVVTPLSALSASGIAETVPWEAVPLTIKEPDKPHLLELEYPSGVPQTLGITVVELIPSNIGLLPTVSAESGIDVAEEIVSDSKTNRLQIHRIVFWPKTKSPMLLLTNRQPKRDALFGKVNTFRLTDALPQPFDGEPQRLFAGYVHRPEIFESPASSTGAADWETFYEGTKHFVDRLRHGGYDGTMLVVAANGKTIYPSTRYGSQVGIDGRPSQNDVLELLARLFDREGMTLVPAIDFNSPLPLLEHAIQRNPNLAVELAWWGGNGPVFLPSDRSGKVIGPFYNLLHPFVQDVMIDAVRELALRCVRHPSFGGISVILAPDGFAQIADPFWGIDDTTIARFQQETNVEFPNGAGASTEPNRLVERVRFFQTNAVAMEAWIRWRTLKVNEFYRRVVAALTEIRPDATLYLAGGTMLDGPNIRQHCIPSLVHRMTLAQSLRLTGFDPALFAETPSIMFLRPSRVASDSEHTAVYRELETAEFDQTARNSLGSLGTLFFHESPPNEQTVIVPGGDRNRRRFVQRLTQEDVLTFFDGGMNLPLGEEESLYPFAAAFRKLPKTPFQTFLSNAPAKRDVSLQPVTVRFLETPSGLFVYLLNDAPFSVDTGVVFSVSPNVALEELSGRRPIDPALLVRKDGRLSWPVALQPYDFIAVHLAEPTASLLDVAVHRPSEICGPNGTLKRKVDELGERFQTARNGVTWDHLENPGCEMKNDSKTELVGWTRYGDESFVATFDQISKHSGGASLKLEWKTPTATPNAVLSNAIPNPETGRLFVSAFVSVAEQASVNVVLTAKHRETTLFRSFPIGPAAATNGSHWRRIVAPFDLLPKENLEDLRIGFQLAGPGTVWIDDVMLYRVAFTQGEQIELYEKVSVAHLRRSKNRISELLVLLEGYWPQFLLQNVPVEPIPPPMVVADVRPTYSENKAVPVLKPEPPKSSSPGVFDRFKGWFTK